MAIHQPMLPNRWRRTIAVVILIALLVLVAMEAQAQAPVQDPNIFTGNRVEDAVDALPGNGLCDANDQVLQGMLGKDAGSRPRILAIN